MRKQRDVKQESFKRRTHEVFWFPRVDRDGELSVVTQMEKTDWYAVVDDIGEETVVLEIASWPKLDKGNHLRFDEIYIQAYPLDLLQNAINRERAKYAQPADDRPLRTGDAFSIRCEDRPGENIISPEFKGSILDITAAAREQAKIAMYGAVTRKLSPTEEIEMLELSKEPGRFQQTIGKRDRLLPHNPDAIARSEV